MPIFGAYSLLTGLGFYCAIPAVTLAHGFCGFIRGTDPLSRLARQVRGTRDTGHHYPELYFFLYCKALVLKLICYSGLKLF